VLARHISQQIQYSLLVRDAEYELIRWVSTRRGRDGLEPADVRTAFGQIRRDAPQPTEGRLAALGRHQGGLGALYRIVDVCSRSPPARRHAGADGAQLGSRQTGRGHVIVGARTEEQLRDNLASATWQLSAEEMARLDEASAVPEPYLTGTSRTWAGARNPRLPRNARR